MSNTLIRIAALLGAAVLALGAPASAQEGQVDCSTAEEDIARLEDEKKSTDERKVKGVMSIMPIGIAINAVSSAGSDTDKDKEMHVDEYNAQLDKRIAEIKAACKP